MNPVLRKDLLGLLRLKRVAAIQLCFIGVLGLLVLVTWPQAGVLAGTVEVAAGEAQAQLVRAHDPFLLGLVITQIVLLLLFVPGIAGVALTGEKEANTLEMLYASRLKPREIISGKVLLSISFPLLLLISGLPFVALLNYRGDVQGGELMWAYLILVLTAIFLAVLSLAISALCSQSATALVIAYLTVLVVSGGVLVPAAIMLEGQSGLSAQLIHYIRGASPVAAALSLLRPGLDIGGAERQLIPIWQVFIPVSLGVTLAASGLLIHKLRRAPAESEGFGTTGREMEHRSMARRVMFLIDPKKKRKPIGHMPPLIVKESRTSSLRSGRWMIRIFYGSLFLSLGLAVMSLYGGVEHQDLLGYVAQVLVALQFAVIVLVVPSLTSSAISSEIENGTFEVLRMAPLSGGQIFWGKFVPAFLPALLPILALLPAYGAISFIDHGYITRILKMLPVIIMAVVFCCTLGLTCSSFVTNTARATIASYIIAAALFVLPLFAWWAIGQQITADIGRWLAFLSPLVVSLNLLPIGTPAVEAMYGLHLWLMVGLCVIMLLVSRARLSMLLRQG